MSLFLFLIFECKECKSVTSYIPREENVTKDKDCTDKCSREIRSDEDREDANWFINYKVIVNHPDSSLLEWWEEKSNY